MMSALSIVMLCALTGLSTTYSDGSKELLLVQMLWRHGDRSPTKTFPSDGFQEDSWTFGGGGWGQLSPRGMQQHLNLGKKLRERYVTNYGFLSPKYNSKEVYVRSTDVNRTIISAMSNLLGQYGQDDNSSVSGVDYPDVSGWPRGYVPIAVHTVDDDTDHLGNMDSTCPLRDQIWSLAKESDEVKNFAASSEVQSLLGNLTNNCGENITIDNLWIVTNALYIEKIYYNDELKIRNPWFTPDLYKQADAINDRVQLYQNGIFNTTPNNVNGYDVGLMTRKAKGGPILNDMVMHINLKLMCQNQNTTNCTWINNLKNYIYSAHDTTIYALFSALLVEEYAVKPSGEYPLYSATVLLELYIDRNDNKPYFKLLYHDKEGSNFTEVTMGVQGCPTNSSYCDLDILRKFAKTTQPDQPIDQWCFTDLQGNGSSITTISTLLLAAILAVHSNFSKLF